MADKSPGDPRDGAHERPSPTPLLRCRYRDPAQRPTIGWCPHSCTGPVTHSERAGNGDQLLYCEAHAYWRRKTIHLPLVRRMPPDEHPMIHAHPDDSVGARAPARRPSRETAGPPAHSSPVRAGKA